PEPPRRASNENNLAMLVEPQGVSAEAFRMLRTNFEFVNLERGAKTIMVTSAVQEEGKSTTVANLAVALARARHSVALVDLDLRRPMLDRFFDLSAGAGLTEVALGYTKLEDALLRVAITDAEPAGEGAGNGNGAGREVQGFLDVLAAGLKPPDGGEFASSRAGGDILAELRG